MVGRLGDPIVILTLDEARYCAHIGIERRLLARQNGRGDCYGEPKYVWDADVVGATAEYCVCKYRDHPWGASLKVGEPDCGVGIQARGTWRQNGCLILHDTLGPDWLPRDKDNDFFVLVVAETDFRYRLAGGIYGRHGKLPFFWKDKTTIPRFDRGAYGVEQMFLHQLPAVPRRSKIEVKRDGLRISDDGELMG